MLSGVRLPSYGHGYGSAVAQVRFIPGKSDLGLLCKLLALLVYSSYTTDITLMWHKYVRDLQIYVRLLAYRTIEAGSHFSGGGKT